MTLQQIIVCVLLSVIHVYNCTFILELEECGDIHLITYHTNKHKHRKHPHFEHMREVINIYHLCDLINMEHRRDVITTNHPGDVINKEHGRDVIKTDQPCDVIMWDIDVT